MKPKPLKSSILLSAIQKIMILTNAIIIGSPPSVQNTKAKYKKNHLKNVISSVIGVETLLCVKLNTCTSLYIKPKDKR